MLFSLSKSVLVILTIAFSVNVQQSCGLKILGLFPFHVYSHFVICEELMRELAAKGHQVDVYSHFPQNKPLPNYRDFSLNGTLSRMVNNLTFDDISFMTPAETVKRWLRAHGKPVCELLGHSVFQKLFHDPPKDPAYDIVIIETSLIHCFIPWVRQLNVPIVGVVAAAMLDWHCDPLGSPMNLATDPSIFSHYVAPMTFFERLNNFYIYHTVNRVFIKYSKEQEELVEKYLGSGFPSTVGMLKEMSLVLVNQHASLNGARFFSPIVIPVPGLHIVDHNETLLPVVQKWLDESTNGCIYFSFGSMIRIETFPKHILDAFYKSFENIKHVRVLLKIAKPEELPPGLPSNVLVQSWIQQKQVLKHENVKAFVTHCGLMGTQEAIYYGVPLVAVPLFGDQYFNAKACAKRKIAVYIEVQEITEKSFTHALKEVLENPTYMKIVKKFSSEFKDRPLTPAQTALFWIEYVVRHGKDALRSRIVDMPWWQVSSIDIYAFIASIVLLVLYVIIKILKLLSGLILIHISTGSKIKEN